MKAEKTILDLQSELESALDRAFSAELPENLKPLAKLAPPRGFRIQVSLRHAKNQRQVKRNSPAERWSPDSGLIAISYKPVDHADAVASLAEVRGILEREPVSRARFNPVTISGEPLSDTVLRDRG